MTNGKHLYLFLGKPASGKETQGRLLAEKLDAPLFMVGNRFREIIASGSPLGERIKSTYNSGKLMPAWVAVYLFQEFLFGLSEDKSAVFEGTGRAKEEAEMFDKTATWLERPYTVFFLDVSDEIIIDRIHGRGRDKVDTDEDAIRTRLSEFENTTRPAMEYFDSLERCIHIDGGQSVDAIHEEVMKHISS